MIHLCIHIEISSLDANNYKILVKDNLQVIHIFKNDTTEINVKISLTKRYVFIDQSLYNFLIAHIPFSNSDYFPWPRS